MKTAVIVGAGRGMGNHIAERFAKEGFRVVLVARKKAALETYVAEFKKRGFEAHGETADASETASLTEAFSRIHKKYGAVDVMVYNAALMQGGKTTQLTAEEMMRHFRIDVAGALHCAKEVLPQQLKQGSGTILFTGGMFGVYPNANPDYACMSMDKSALRMLAQMMNEELKVKGIFVGIVNIMGNVGGNEHFAPEHIAELYWQLYQERQDFEVFFS